MFDSFIVPCLFCNEDIEAQTKTGPCLLDVYRFDDPDLPFWVIQDFNGVEPRCRECGRAFRITFDYEVIVRGRKLEPVDNLDMLELKLKEKEDTDGRA
jgi:hypothetical protein